MAELLDPAPQALWFGDGRLRSFAMLHRPSVSNGSGVVICNTLGFDGLLAQRPFRHLAEALADEGFTVVRLDYEGTGDAPGDAHGPGQVKGYLDSIDDAAQLLRSWEGCSTLSLVGVRAGACLAGRYALDHPGVDRLALWAPCHSGSQYVRELRALARFAATARSGSAAQPNSSDGSIEAVGFEFTAETLADLSQLDLVASITHRPAERVLVLDRDDIPPASDIVAALRTVGTDVDHQIGSGWDRFAVPDETESELPRESLDAIATWLSAPAPAPASADPRDAPVAPAARQSARLRVSTEPPPPLSERGVWIDDRLFAVVTMPPDAHLSRRAAVVLSNTGSVSHNGPGRLYVQLARHWANLGFTVIRADLGGTGSSPAPDGHEENRPYDAERIRELSQIVRWVWAETDACDISLFGICSGATTSFHAGLRGAPVDRIVLVNPAIFHVDDDGSPAGSAGRAFRAAYSLRRPRFIRQRLWDALTRPRELAAFTRRAFRGYRYLMAAAARRTLDRIGIHVANHNAMADDLQRLSARGISILTVFAAGEPGEGYLRALGGATLDQLVSDGAVTIAEVDGGDHVFSPLAARRELIDVVTGYLDRSCPAARTPEPTTTGT